MFQMCENETPNGVLRNGGCEYSAPSSSKSDSGLHLSDGEYANLRVEAAVPIPAHADAATYAPLLCAGVTVFNSMRRLQVQSGSLVAIQGLGGLGHLAVQYAHKMGYKVVALSSSGAKEKFARDLGADSIWMPVRGIWRRGCRSWGVRR